MPYLLMSQQNPEVQLLLNLSDVDYLLESLEEELELLGEDQAQGSREERIREEILLQTYR